MSSYVIICATFRVGICVSGGVREGVFRCASGRRSAAAGAAGLAARAARAVVAAAAVRAPARRGGPQARHPRRRARPPRGHRRGDGLRHRSQSVKSLTNFACQSQYFLQLMRFNLAFSTP
jgi:hypothetical protein